MLDMFSNIEASDKSNSLKVKLLPIGIAYSGKNGNFVYCLVNIEAV